MPELPDVENFRRYLEQHALHKIIDAVEVRSVKVLRGISGAELGRRLEGRSFDGTHRHGKHLFAALDAGASLDFHFGLTGCFVFFGGRDDGADPKHDRVRFDFASGEHLAFVDQRMFGRIAWVDDVDEYIRKKRLGPDALTIDEKTFRERFARKRGALKAVLMDQAGRRRHRQRVLRRDSLPGEAAPQDRRRES